MHRLIKVFAASTLLFGANGYAQSAEITMGYTQKNVVPALVSFDREGGVSQVVTPDKLSPEIQAQLERNIKEVVAALPAFKNGTKASQKMMRMKLEAIQRVDGNYDGRFVYLDAKPVPPGAWAWQRAGTRYALVDDSPYNARMHRVAARSGVVLRDGKQVDPVTPRVRSSQGIQNKSSVSAPPSAASSPQN
jgi:hypothetical protein